HLTMRRIVAGISSDPTRVGYFLGGAFFSFTDRKTVNRTHCFLFICFSLSLKLFVVRSIVKSVLYLREDFSGVKEVGPSSKCETVIEQEPTVGHIQGTYRDR